MVNRITNALAAAGLSSLVATTAVAEQTQTYVTEIVKDNGAKQSVLVVPASECFDGGGTTFTKKWVKMMEWPNGTLVNCDAFTVEQRKIMDEMDRGDDRENTPDDDDPTNNS